jgi:histidyl-tRNA synthetase
VVAELESKFGAQVSAKAGEWLNSIQGELSVPSELDYVFSTVGALHPGKLRFDPTLVRGMGYYTGPIFEIEHPGSGSSIGGGGRYDGMVGRWLGTDVPAVGISIGFERAVDLIDGNLGSEPDGIVLILENDSAAVLTNALKIQRELIESGEEAVRLERRPKKLNILLESLGEQGFGRFASVDENTVNLAALNMRVMGHQVN